MNRKERIERRITDKEAAMDSLNVLIEGDKRRIDRESDQEIRDLLRKRVRDRERQWNKMDQELQNLREELRGISVLEKQGRHKPPLQRFREFLESRDLWWIFVWWFGFLLTVISNWSGVWDQTSPCLRLWILTVLTALGGFAIVGFGSFSRSRIFYLPWDRIVTFILVVIATTVLSWFTYQECVFTPPVTPTPTATVTPTAPTRAVPLK